MLMEKDVETAAEEGMCVLMGQEPMRT